jgi:hypothetical protein
MSAATDSAKALSDLLKKLGTPAPIEYPDANDPVSVLVMSMLLWESNTSKAMTAYQKLKTAVVDFNELRVCMSQELIDCVGVRYPLASERCQRLRASLNDIFQREHDVKLEQLRGAGKRDVKKYIETLEGITPYASARVQLMCFETHAMPADEQLRSKLIDAGIIEAALDVAEASNWLTRYVKSGEGIAAHLAMQAWVDTGKPALSKAGGKSPRSSAGRKRTPAAGKTKRRSASSSKVS